MIGKIIAAFFGSAWNLKEFCQKTKNPFYIFLYDLYQYENSSALAWDSEFSSPPLLPHGMKGIFVTGTAKIGKSCILFQQVTIGSNTCIDSKNVGSPIIGDNCWLAPGSKIIGHISVGNNCRIGPNAVVYRDIPDNSTILSNGKIIQQTKRLDNRVFIFDKKTKHWRFYSDGSWIILSCSETLKKLHEIYKKNPKIFYGHRYITTSSFDSE